MAAGAEEFCKDYLVIDAKKATLYDIACILICSTDSLKKRAFYDERCQVLLGKSTTVNLRRRWLIFVFVVLQKLCIWTKKPLAFTGSFIETWLNLLSSNGGFFGLMMNRIRGKVVKPEESTEKFVSVIGELDTRLKLDASIKKGDGRYKPSLAMMAAKLCYENEAFVKAAVQDQLKMVFIGFYKFWNDYQKQFTSHATIFQDVLDPNLIVIAFRGTTPFDANEWMTNLDISWYELKHANESNNCIGKVHGGYMKALGLQKTKGWPKELEPPPNPNDHQPFAYYKIRENLRDILGKNPNSKFILTGHSLGGALAILFVTVLGLHEETSLLKRLEGVYTFGQPRVGDEGFGRHMMKIIEDYNVKYFRYVYSNDIVPRLPYDDKALFFKHFGMTLYFNSLYIGKVMEEEPNKNYFSMVWVIPMYVNAIWEVIRSFILPYWKGKEYKEQNIAKLFRMVGLIIPGLAAHSPKDYVDITRIGTDLIPTIER